MAEAVTSYHSLKLSDSEMNALLLVKIGEKKVHCKSNNMLLSHFCNTVLLLLSRERNGQFTLCILAEE